MSNTCDTFCARSMCGMAPCLKCLKIKAHASECELQHKFFRDASGCDVPRKFDITRACVKHRTLLAPYCARVFLPVRGADDQQIVFCLRVQIASVAIYDFQNVESLDWMYAPSRMPLTAPARDGSRPQAFIHRSLNLCAARADFLSCTGA